MSSEGTPLWRLKDGAGKRISVAVIASSWHERVVYGLITGALYELGRLNCGAQLIRVPGSFELPLACKRILASGRYDAAVALGVVLRGETPHFDYVAAAASNGLTEVALAAGKPIGFGLLTVDTLEQALERATTPTSRYEEGQELAHRTCLGLVEAAHQEARKRRLKPLPKPIPLHFPGENKGVEAATSAVSLCLTLAQEVPE